MLDGRPSGLCAKRVLETLTAHIPNDAQARAIECVTTAVKLRNALSHGAIPSYGIADHRAAGHIFAGATRILAEAAHHKMAEVSAYYIWRGHEQFSDTGLIDWLSAEHAIFLQVQIGLTLRLTLPSGELLAPAE